MTSFIVTVKTRTPEHWKGSDVDNLMTELQRSAEAVIEKYGLPLVGLVIDDQVSEDE